jgi:hypothetical protein
VNCIAVLVFDIGTQKWLAEDERSWTSNYDEAAAFTQGNEAVALDIGKRAQNHDTGGALRVMQVYA